MKYFVSKVVQVYSDFWAILKNIPFQMKTALETFWASFGKNWATFNLSIWSHWLQLSPEWHKLLFCDQLLSIEIALCEKTMISMKEFLLVFRTPTFEAAFEAALEATGALSPLGPEYFKKVKRIKIQRSENWTEVRELFGARCAFTGPIRFIIFAVL